MDTKKQPIEMNELFGCNVFTDKVMKARLPKQTYRTLRETTQKGVPMSQEVSNVVANAMKDWAIEKGATHYTHWFQPLTGFTAEKHDSFISPTEDGGVIMEFSGKQLIQGEPDASSFPSGGLRATFEARGYTAWDATSPAFLKEDAHGNRTLCIPTAFCSYTGQALDKKTPLLRSMDAISRQALRLLRAMGNTTASRVTSTVGPEQEYFLIDKSLYEQRLDLITAGRTLFGKPSPKGQELDDHYFGAIKDRVSSYMADLDAELWKLGISSKTRHNEVAPSQYEMAPIFSTTNVATDHNQLVMETMRKVALRHDLVCLLHEKPYAGINGSGKHNNWSLSSDDGLNLLEPGNTPGENALFLLTLAALMRAVDRHADILRASAANSGNDHRLGANEAPPAIVSIFMGDEVTEILESIGKGEKASSRVKSFLKIGADSLPELPKDNTDRNRTSPFAFTGNKFEFRMVPSSGSIAGPNVVLNTIVAEVFDDMAQRLEKATDVNTEATAIVREIVQKHERIVFNGNGYSEDWLAEAEKRGLPNLTSTVDALKVIVSDKSVALFEKYGVFSKEELHSRYEVYTEQYAMHINIEALTAIDMVKRQYLPAAMTYMNDLAGSLNAVKGAGTGSVKVQKTILDKVGSHLDAAYNKLGVLEDVLGRAQAEDDLARKAEQYRDEVFAAAGELRGEIDALEEFVPKHIWPVPSYEDMLFYN